MQKRVKVSLMQRILELETALSGLQTRFFVIEKALIAAKVVKEVSDKSYGPDIQ
jgi:hypothetical protein